MKIIDINDAERECVSVAPDPGYPGFMKVQFKNHHEWLSFEEFEQKNPSLFSLQPKADKQPSEIVGVVSSATDNTLNDKKQSWLPDVYKGYKIWISRGQGEGQVRFIMMNEKTRLTIDKNWDTKPNSSSQYVISMNIHDVQVMGNTLPAEDIKKLEKKAKKLKKVRDSIPPLHIDLTGVTEKKAK